MKQTIEAMDNFLEARREYWRDYGLCEKAIEIQADHEWSEVEQQWLDGKITDLEYGR